MKLLDVLLNKLFYIFYIICFLACNIKIDEDKNTSIIAIDSLQINYTNNIAPILEKNCVTCHRKNGAGPFSLTNATEVLKHAKMIKKVTKSGYMPPWPADANYSHFLDERILTKKEKKEIELWVNNGSKLGDTAKITKKIWDSVFVSKPDMILKMPKPFYINGDNKDKFMVMKFPFEIAENKFVRYIEIVADNKKIVHHINTNLVSYDGFTKDNITHGSFAENAAFKTKKEIYEALHIPNNNRTYPTLKPSICNYLPGMQAYKYPDGIGGFILPKKGLFLADEIHYGPSIENTFDNTYFNIFFMDKAPVRPVQEITMGTNGISIILPPLIIYPNTVSKHITSLEVTADISLLNLNPHMHLLGKKFKAYIVNEYKDTIPLIKINRWDFRWQYVYTFKKILKVNKGSKIIVEGEFDNTTSNPLNPNYPPKIVSDINKSMRTSDEMFQLIICYLPYKVGDENISLAPNANK